MKKEKIKTRIYDNSEAAERRYLQKLKADQSMFQAFFSFIPQCFCNSFDYPHGSSAFPQTDLPVKQSQNTVNKECLKSRKNK